MIHDELWKSTSRPNKNLGADLSSWGFPNSSGALMTGEKRLPARWPWVLKELNCSRSSKIRRIWRMKIFGV